MGTQIEYLLSYKWGFAIVSLFTGFLLFLYITLLKHHIYASKLILHYEDYICKMQEKLDLTMCVLPKTIPQSINIVPWYEWYV